MPAAAPLPPRPDLEHLKNQAKFLLQGFRNGDPAALARFQSLGGRAATAPKLADAQRLIARHYGFPSWPKLKARVTQLNAAVATPEDPIPLIHSAFRTDNAPLLRQILDRHPELKLKVNDPLFPFDSPAICHVRSRAMLDVLLDAGADINARSTWWAGGFGLMDFADPDLAAYAVQRGATVDAHAAARLGMLDHLRDLITKDPSLVHARGGDGQTPLHFASTTEIAEFLLAHGADIDARDIDHESTPAQYMLRDRQPVARYLVSRGCRTDILMAAALGDLDLVRHHLAADPAAIRTAVNDEYFPKQNPRAGGTIYIWTLGQNKTAHTVARQFGHDAVFRFLMDQSPDELKLAQAFELGDEPTFKALLAARPNLVASLTDAEKRKLPDAAQDENFPAVRLMLAAGWPIDARGRHHATALHWAAWHGHADMVREILRYHPPINDDDNDFKSSPLGWTIHASKHGWHPTRGDYAAVADLLLQAGAKLPKNEPDGSDAVKAVLARYAT
jgi:ankyrin repeat protein